MDEDHDKMKYIVYCDTDASVPEIPAHVCIYLSFTSDSVLFLF